MKKFSIERTFNENGSKCTGFDLYRDYFCFRFFVGHCYDYDDAIKTAKRLGATKITKDY